MVREVFSILVRLLSLDERRCASCREPFIPHEAGAASAFFCPQCRPSFLFREAGFCPYCGEPFAVADSPIVPCGDCLQKLPPWNDFFFCGIYEGALRELILRAKFRGGLDALHVLGMLLADRCAEHYSSAPLPHVIVPLPLHPSRLRERGLDQCLEMARPISKRLGIPVRSDILIRQKASAPQAMLNREQRRELAQPFASLPVQGMHVLLLDDVCTTGATLGRAAEALLLAGAAAVDVAVAARASRHSVQHAETAGERREAALP